jgi:hypothetical protein
MPAWEFARFLTLVEQGTPVQRRAPQRGETVASRELEDVEASIRWTREFLSALRET